MLLYRCRAQASHRGGFSFHAAPPLECAGLVVMVPGLSCSTACRIFPDQVSDMCLLHWQAESPPIFITIYSFFFWWQHKEYFGSWSQQKDPTIRRDIATDFSHIALTAWIEIMKNLCTSRFFIILYIKFKYDTFSYISI